ncbi:MAG: hypothetical protein J5927_00800 [Oscillospiraceae bacterium]|nr:hypothetical protein [Oscillospiraceae bacterium]
MFLKLTKAFGKPICVVLYAVFAALAAKKKPIPLLVLALMHATEYGLVGRKVAAEQGLSLPEGLAQCLAFGFTWWLPIRKAQ